MGTDTILITMMTPGGMIVIIVPGCTTIITGQIDRTGLPDHLPVLYVRLTCQVGQDKKGTGRQGHYGKYPILAFCGSIGCFVNMQTVTSEIIKQGLANQIIEVKLNI